ncbi:hypothetical protein TYRP_006751 [Tyrophagus putrescentiae]|nr:hypothetical protein TYRP_006751 [Tyrophagus putrescentiae]
MTALRSLPLLAIITIGLAALLPAAVEGQSCASCFYHVFTKSWVQTTCKLEDKSQGASNTKECKPQAQIPTNITIHGLWPQIVEKEAILSYCKENKEKFDASKLAGITARLNATWPTAFTGSGQSNEGFWKHEWDKHGVCSPLTMLGYFERSLALDLRYPIDAWLASAGIVPSNSKLYAVEQVQAAFNRYIAADQYVLKCATIKGGLQLLKDVMLCVSYGDTARWSSAAP